jgi:hypothetical protein
MGGADALAPIPVTLWDTAKGIDLETPLSRLGPDKIRYVENFKLTVAGRLISRGGVGVIGAQASSDITGLVNASDESAVEYPVRVRTDGVEVFSGNAWVVCTGPTLAIPEYAFVEFSSWAGKLMFNDPLVGVYELNLATKSYTLIADAPAGKHLTVFGGRVIVSNISGEPTRVQWSVKNDNTDWAGLGSGNDDMLSAPGGVVDIQHGIVPLTDTEALIIRSNSIWIMQLTGLVDTPFNFFHRFTEGTDSPASIAPMPNQQVAMLGREDVVVVSPSGIQSIGLPIRKELIGQAYKPQNAVGVYDSKNMEYRLYVPPTTVSTESIVWRYKFLTQTWHKDVFPFVVRRMATGNAQATLTINELTGTINDLTGPINQLGLLGRTPGILFANGARYVGRESEAGTTDMTTAGSTQVVPAEIWTGLVQPAGPLNRVSMLNLQLEYTSTRSIDVVIEISTDGGGTWEGYGSVTLLSTTAPRLGVFRRTVERPQFMIRLAATDAVGLELIAVHASTLPGAPVNL